MKILLERYVFQNWLGMFITFGRFKINIWGAFRKNVISQFKSIFRFWKSNLNFQFLNIHSNDKPTPKNNLTTKKVLFDVLLKCVEDCMKISKFSNLLLMASTLAKLKSFEIPGWGSIRGSSSKSKTSYSGWRPVLFKLSVKEKKLEIRMIELRFLFLRLDQL